MSEIWKKRNADAVIGHITPFYGIFLRQQATLKYIRTLEFSRSSDPWVLFEEFAKRFSVVATENKPDEPRSLRSIVKAGGGDRDELKYVLLNLFTSNGIDCESVLLGVRQQVAPGRESKLGVVDRVLVYVPAIDQYFDPILPVSNQPKGPDWTSLLEGRHREHFLYPLGRSEFSPSGPRAKGYVYYAKPIADRGLKDTGCATSARAKYFSDPRVIRETCHRHRRQRRRALLCDQSRFEAIMDQATRNWLISELMTNPDALRHSPIPNWPMNRQPLRQVTAEPTSDWVSAALERGVVSNRHQHMTRDNSRRGPCKGLRCRQI
jgi:hypothetical protein